MKRLLFLLALTGCQTVSTHRFDMDNGERVICRQVHVEHCGLTLEGCGDEASVEFQCLKNVKYIGPWTGSIIPADYAPVMMEDAP